MTHGSFFTGIGGFDIASEEMGWDNIFQCEKDESCIRDLGYWFPDVSKHKNILDFNGAEYANRIDVVSGGFPCQPFSIAGKRKGKQDERFLWEAQYRALCEIQSPWFVGENVAGILSMENGRILEGILDDLEGATYSPQTFCFPACGLGAQHRRERIWIIAYSHDFLLKREAFNRKVSGETRTSEEKKQGQNRKWSRGRFAYGPKEILQAQRDRNYKGSCPKPFLRGNDDGVSDRLDRFKKTGNAIFIDCALEIFRSIEKNTFSNK